MCPSAIVAPVLVPIVVTVVGIGVAWGVVVVFQANRRESQAYRAAEDEFRSMRKPKGSRPGTL